MRCFGDGDPLYAEYHDTEWGVPVRGEAELLERFCLEAFQSGLSWLTILRKRPAFRTAFADFDPEAVAAFTDDDAARLLADAGIVRNRAKIAAAIDDARAVVRLWDAGRSLTEVVWSHAPEPRAARPASYAEVPPSTPESVALAKELKAVGFRFIVGRIMDQEVSITCNPSDAVVDCPGVPGIHDLAPGPGRSHDLFGQHLPAGPSVSDPYGLSPLQPAEQRSRRDAESDCLFAVEPARAGIFFQDIPERRHPVADGERGDGVPVEPHP